MYESSAVPWIKPYILRAISHELFRGRQDDVDTVPKVTLTSGVSEEEEDDNIIMFLLSNDSPSIAAVAVLVHSSLITMVESCTRYEIFVL